MKTEKYTITREKKNQLRRFENLGVIHERVNAHNQVNASNTWREAQLSANDTS